MPPFLSLGSPGIAMACMRPRITRPTYSSKIWNGLCSSLVTQCYMYIEDRTNGRKSTFTFRKVNKQCQLLPWTLLPLLHCICCLSTSCVFSPRYKMHQAETGRGLRQRKPVCGNHFSMHSHFDSVPRGLSFVVAVGEADTGAGTKCDPKIINK